MTSYEQIVFAIASNSKCSLTLQQLTNRAYEPTPNSGTSYKDWSKLIKSMIDKNILQLSSNKKRILVPEKITHFTTYYYYFRNWSPNSHTPVMCNMLRGLRNIKVLRENTRIMTRNFQVNCPECMVIKDKWLELSGGFAWSMKKIIENCK